MFIFDEEGGLIGHYNAHLLGQDLSGPLGTDAEGYKFGPEMLAVTGDGAWVTYVYNNPPSDIAGGEPRRRMRRNGRMFDGSGELYSTVPVGGTAGRDPCPCIGLRAWA